MFRVVSFSWESVEGHCNREGDFGTPGTANGSGFEADLGSSPRSTLDQPLDLPLDLLLDLPLDVALDPPWIYLHLQPLLGLLLVPL